MSSAPFALRARIQAGFRSLSLLEVLTLEGLDDLTRRDQADDRYTSGLNRLSSAFFAVDKSQHSVHCSVRGADRLDGTESRSTGCDHIFYHGYVVTLSEGTLYELSRSVSLCLLSYGKCSQWMIRAGAGVADRVGNGIGAKRKTANRINYPSRLTQSRKPQPADYCQALWAHRCQPCIDVVLGLSAGRERELPTLGRTFGQQRDECGMIGHGAGGYGFL